MQRQARVWLAIPVVLSAIGPNHAPAQAPPASEPQPDSVPAGASEFDAEVFVTYAYTWKADDGTEVIECLGNFELRMGAYAMRGHDAVIWFRRPEWRNRPFYDVEVFLWRDAEVRQPGGTIESGDALLVTLRTFGKLVLNADGYTSQRDDGSELYTTASGVRSGVGPRPERPLEEMGETVDVPPGAVEIVPPSRRPPAAVSYGSRELNSEIRDGKRLVVAIGDVYVSRGKPGSGDFLELRADAAVLYLHESAVGEALPGMAEPATRLAEEPPPESPARERLDGDGKSEREAARDIVEAVYLEGDVVLTRGTRMIRSPKIFYDLQSDRALILDAVMRALASQRNVPVYIRAEEVRQVSANVFKTVRPVISTSEFHTPHVALAAGEATITDRTLRNERGEVTGVIAGTYEARNTTLNLDGVPIAYWPYSKGDFTADRMAFRSAKFGYSDEFGGTMETRWYLFNLLGLDAPEGYDATLRLDYFTQRGPGVGIDVDYERENYFGLLRSYYIHDSEEDDLGGNPSRGGPPDTNDRGRVLWRHRQFLEQGWELSLETSYISDDQFLEQYERNEFENAKEQETVLYLLNRRDNWQFSTLVDYSLNDWLTQSEHFPDAQFSLIGEPLGDVATFYSESRAGVVRYDLGNDEREFLRPDHLRESGAVLRGDTREELTLRLPELGPVKLTPYSAVRGTAWDDSPDEGGEGRIFGSYGLKGNMYLQRVYEDVESRLLDLHRLRHILKPEFAAWMAHDNRNSDEQFPFDEGVETIDDFGGGMIGLRQRWQTKRGEPGRWRTVDWIVLDVKSVFFSNPRPWDNTHGNYISHRPEDSISSNHLSVDFLYRISDTTALVYDGVYDWNRGNAGVSNVSLAYERLPRLASFIGWRYIHDTNSNLIGLGSNYKLNEKHTIGFRDYYDIDRGRNLETQLIYVRRWPRWYTAISVEWDRAIDDFSVSLSIWPEGAPNLAIGSKRYTPLGDSVGIRP